MATCKSCGQTIVWAKTENGKAIPIDVNPRRAEARTAPGEGWATLTTEHGATTARALETGDYVDAGTILHRIHKDS